MRRTSFTVGFVNCNRLHYLRSCVESALFTCGDSHDVQWIIVDNASVEPGTIEYLNAKERQGFTIVRNDARDPSNEFARGLNTICRLATGEHVIPLQGDMQFVRHNWLDSYATFVATHAYDDIGCVCIDAQRKVTLEHNTTCESDDPDYVMVTSRDPIAGAGDVIYTRNVIDRIVPWKESDNLAHEGGNDSETEMLNRVRNLGLDMSFCLYIPIVPFAIAIYTDRRGTNARVRGNRRYGDYWPPKRCWKYYEIIDKDDYPTRNVPYSIEEVARPVDWNAPLDEMGSWMKNPIRPELATDRDYVELV